MKLAVLVVFYNTTPSESSALKSIAKSDLSCLQGIDITLWNNGPNLFSDLETSWRLRQHFANARLTSDLYETTQNFALSHLYNDFIAQKSSSSTHFLILDDDSTLPDDFFVNLANNSAYGLILPVITDITRQTLIGPGSRDEQHTPYYTLTPNKEYKNRCVESITSGLCFSSEFAKLLTQNYGEVFNEAFALYGIDLCFYRNVSNFMQTHPDYPFVVAGTLQHNLSMFLDENEARETFKAREVAYAQILLRLFSKKKSRRSAINYILKKCLPQKPSMSQIFLYFKCAITKRHPKITKAHNQAFAEATTLSKHTLIP